jgi:LPPG:FO 2-phospho-L-lactate transferase
VITVLCGGFGAARFLPGLQETVDDLCCVVNTGDDLEYLSLHVAPDVDSVLYALSGCFDEERGWGVTNDTFRCNSALARYSDDWFHVGDEDLALSLKRTAHMRSGARLSQAIAALADAWGLSARVLPMTDEPVRTIVVTEHGNLSLQAYVVAERGRPTVTGVVYDGLSSARPAPGVLQNIEAAELVLLAPSNPISSLGPILGLASVREVLQARAAPTIAVTPVVSAQPPATAPEKARAHVRAALMAARGLPHDATTVARLYRDLIQGFVLDERDAVEAPAIRASGLSVLLADTLSPPGPGRAQLACEIVDFARRLERPHP